MRALAESATVERKPTFIYTVTVSHRDPWRNEIIFTGVRVFVTDDAANDYIDWARRCYREAVITVDSGLVLWKGEAPPTERLPDLMDDVA